MSNRSSRGFAAQDTQRQRELARSQLTGAPLRQPGSQVVTGATAEQEQEQDVQVYASEANLSDEQAAAAWRKTPPAKDVGKGASSATRSVLPSRRR